MNTNNGGGNMGNSIVVISLHARDRNPEKTVNIRFGGTSNEGIVDILMNSHIYYTRVTNYDHFYGIADRRYISYGQPIRKFPFNRDVFPQLNFEKFGSFDVCIKYSWPSWIHGARGEPSRRGK